MLEVREDINTITPATIILGAGILLRQEESQLFGMVGV